MKVPHIAGGCLCGAIRYRIDVAPTVSMICHCRTCRAAGGAPVVAWVTFPTTDVSFVQGTPAAFHSSPPVTRTFCPSCGTPLTYVHADRPGEIDVTTCSLDDPAAFPPTYHAWLEHRVGWVRFGDGLPTFETTKRD
jgi:hypothetical protein